MTFNMAYGTVHKISKKRINELNSMLIKIIYMVITIIFPIIICLHSRGNLLGDKEI